MPSMRSVSAAKVRSFYEMLVTGVEMGDKVCRFEMLVRGLAVKIGSWDQK